MKKLLFYLFISIGMIQFANAQTVSGVITGADDGGALPGVNVMLKGTANGTITDLDGNYSIDTEGNQDAVLIFSFVGYITKEVPVAGQTTVNVTLDVETTGLDEVVVVGYGVKKKALLTGANTNVKGEDLAELKTASAMEALQGIAPGISIQRNNGAPGAGTKVTIRGAGTIGNAAPLYIVDGVTVGDIDYLNPNDIEAIDVLKDAASAAIYGSRAANGVVLVTTKKGKKGSNVKVDYNYYYGMQNIYKKLPALNAQEYMFIIDESRTNIGLQPFDWQDLIVNGNTYLDANFADNLGQQYGQDVWNKLDAGWTGTDWQDEMSTKNAPVQSHSINITGGGQDFTFALGASYLDQASIIGKDIMDAGYKRMTLRLNSEFVLFKLNNEDLITVGENFTFTNSETRQVATGNIYWNDLHNALIANPLIPAKWENQILQPWTSGYGPTLEGVNPGMHNPIAQMYYNRNYNWGKGNNIAGNVYGVVEPIKGLKFRSAFGINSWFGNERNWTSVYQFAERFRNTVDGARMQMNRGADITFTNTLSYDLDIQNEHKINVLVGSEMLKRLTNMTVGGSRQGTLYENPDHAYIRNTNNATEVGQISNWGEDWAAQRGGLMSYFGRVSYSFKEKYLFDAIMRADGSSRFAEGHKWGYFPSVSAGWIFSEESFLGGLDWLSFGKLRASWGQNGNEDIRLANGDYASFVYMSNIEYINQGYYFGPNKDVPNVAAIIERVPTPDITWETSEQLNFGVDLNFLNSRLGVNFDWYKKTTKDWLVNAPTIGTAGAQAPFVNGGDVENTGFEAILSWNDRIGEFKYGITLSGAYNKNEVTKIENAEGILLGSSHVLSQGTSDIARVKEGHPIGYFIGYETAGIFQNQTDVDNYVTSDGTPIIIGGEENTPRQPGDVIFVDQNDDGIIDDEDRVPLGNPMPDYEVGIQLNAEYKGIYFNATLTGKFGMQVMQSYRSFGDSPMQNYTTSVFDRWHGEGTSNRYPRLSYTPNRNTNNISDIYMHDADYLRINNVTIGYRFDKILQNVKWMKAASIYTTFNNLYTFTKYEGMDADVGYGPDNDAWSTGIDLGLFPLPRTVIFGVNVTF